jgi:hypothetical protein
MGPIKRAKTGKAKPTELWVELCQAWWHAPVIPALKEAEVEGF